MKSAVLAACGLVLFVGCAADDVVDEKLSDEVQASNNDDDDDDDNDDGTEAPFQQNDDSVGLVSMEAEHRHFAKAKNGKAWNLTSPSSASNGEAIKVGPNTGSLVEWYELHKSPRVTFKVKFEKTGKHYLWLRGRAPNGNDDSAHGGIDYLPEAPRVSGFGTSFSWANETMDGFRATIWVFHKGVHHVQVWMREDGFELDKVVIAKSGSYQPNGAGPPESPRSCGNNGNGNGHGHGGGGGGGGGGGNPNCNQAVCGNGVVETGEACDGGACCTAACSFATTASVCRGSAGACDVAESCSGTSAACPADTFVSAGSECRGSAGACDVAEACTGSSASCPADTLVSAGTECRGSAGACDAAEACTGSSASCPADAVVAAGTECRGSAGACDVAEACDGSSTACPADTLVSAGTECRGSTGVCDLAEACTGGSAACPADSFVAAGTECRGSGGVCDVAEACTGSAGACPADTLVAAGTECRGSAGACDVAEACTGGSAACPADTLVAAGTECRGSAGTCDVAEACSGGSASCPADNYVAAGTECRGSAGACDVAEACSGGAAACPADDFVAAGTECRGSAGTCDVAEACSGGAAACPADDFVAAGTECRGSTGVCDAAEACSGGAAACPDDAFAAAGTECRGSAGGCDVAETCSGSSNACPADAFAPATTECRASTGACDVGESCSGSSASCPVDQFIPAGTECRGSTGDCDVPESCTGSAGACPADGFVLAGTECRPSAGVCDSAEACSGSDGTCPADVYQPGTTQCRASAGLCDVAEFCTGDAIACPADSVATAGTVCRPEAEVCDIAEVCDGSTVSCPSDGYANEPPVVSAGPDVEVAVTSGTATLTGTASDDGCPSTGSLTTTWSKASGPGTVSFADASAASTTATFSQGGVYVLQLAASDEIQTVTDQTTVTVNIAPSANAGPDRILNAGDTSITLFGTVSDDGVPAAGTLSASWIQVSGPGTAMFAPPDAQVTTVTFSAVGDYVLRLTANDSAMITTDEVVVSVSPAPDLVVDAVVPPPLDGNTLNVTGTASAAVTNEGGTVEDSFAVTFFVDINGNGTLEIGTDTVLGQATQDGVVGGETVSVEASVSGSLDFAGALIYAVADTGNEITEDDETNNYGNSAPPCETEGPSAPFTPVLEWSWTSSTVASTFINSQTTPLVVDMNSDGVADIVFSSHVNNGQTNAVLRAIDGRTGNLLFTHLDGANRLSGIAQLAAGDIDLDGHPEVIGVASNGLDLIAFEHTGALKWKFTPAVPMVWGGAAIADINADGVPEIIAGRTVINADGTLRWTGAAGSGGYVNGPLTPTADLDLDGQAEVLAGNTAYRADGTIMWTLPALPDGLAAVANFDADANPEVVLAGSGRIWVLEHDGTIKWTVSTLVLGGATGGPVAIADFDGDGAVEIGRAGLNFYGVFETDGTLKWTAPIVETIAGSATNSSSAFDFDNDGAAEVVFADQFGIKVFDGSTGAVKMNQKLGSCTGYENPVVADVDADGRAELIAVANNSCALGNTNRGIFVYGNDAWVSSRAIYNQHTYHVTNVNDDASIPTVEEPTTSFRKNVTLACPYALPDLTASFLRVTSVGAAYDLTIRIGNGGANPTPQDVPVTFYDGDPRAGGVPLGTASVSVYLEAGEFEDVTLNVPATPTTGTIWVAADDASDMIGTIYESDELNNLFDSGIGL